jgi:hypothetical protein
MRLKNGLKCKSIFFTILFQSNNFFCSSGQYGHFHGDLPWASCNEGFRNSIGRLVGK